MDFGGAILRLQLRRRKGMEGVDVLELPDSEVGTELPGSVDKSLWKSMSSLFAGKAEDKPGAAPGGLGQPKKASTAADLPVVPVLNLTHCVDAK